MSSPEHIVAVLKGKLGGLFKAFNDEISSAYWFSLFDPVGDADKQWDLLNLRNQIVLTNKKFDMLVDKCELGLHPKIRDRWNDFLQLYVERYEFDKNEIFGKRQWVLKIGKSWRDTPGSANQQISVDCVLPRMTSPSASVN